MLHVAWWVCMSLAQSRSRLTPSFCRVELKLAALCKFVWIIQKRVAFPTKNAPDCTILHINISKCFQGWYPRASASGGGDLLLYRTRPQNGLRAPSAWTRTPISIWFHSPQRSHCSCFTKRPLDWRAYKMGETVKWCLWKLHCDNTQRCANATNILYTQRRQMATLDAPKVLLLTNTRTHQEMR